MIDLSHLPFNVICKLHYDGVSPWVKVRLEEVFAFFDVLYKKRGFKNMPVALLKGKKLRNKEC